MYLILRRIGNIHSNSVSHYYLVVSKNFAQWPEVLVATTWLGERRVVVEQQFRQEQQHTISESLSREWSGSTLILLLLQFAKIPPSSELRIRMYVGSCFLPLLPSRRLSTSKNGEIYEWDDNPRLILSFTQVLAIMVMGRFFHYVSNDARISNTPPESELKGLYTFFCCFTRIVFNLF